MVICVGLTQFEKADNLRDCGIDDNNPGTKRWTYISVLAESTRRDVRRAAVAVLKDRRARK